MPKKKKKGKNAKSKNVVKAKRELLFAEDMQEYAVIDKLLGDRRVTLTLIDGTNKMGIIPGRFRKRNWMKPGNLVLVSAREFQDSKLDIIHKYNDEEKKKLKGYGEIPPTFGEDKDEVEDWGFDFDTTDKELDVDVDDI